MMMWYGVTRQTPKYRCAICVADAKIRVDRECARMRRHGHKQIHAAAQ
jgi:phosphoribosyl-dephospho-CoA transferase